MSDVAIHPAALDEEQLLRVCKLKRGRGSGPGGQHRNKVETAVILTHVPTGLMGQASERRSGEENKRMALRRLRMELALHVRMAYKPASELWRSRVRDKHIALNVNHADFPAMVAEAMDVIEHCRFDVSEAALLLDTTASQLVKLLKDEPRAIHRVNEHRREHGMRQLR